MARRIKEIKIDDPKSRDHGKTFILTEAPADAAEWWAARAFLALTNAGAEIPDGVQSQGMAGLATMGVQALFRLPAEAVKPLADEMFTCVQYQHDPRHPLQPILPGAVSQIEEVATRLRLRLALVELHTGFTGLAELLTTASAPPSADAKPSS